MDEEHTLEKLRVSDRLTAVEVKLDGVQKTLEAVSVSLLGNGQSGLNVRVDRLEQSESKRTWMDRLGITTTVGLVTKVFSDWLTSR